jgi:hypothetical protein
MARILDAKCQQDLAGSPPKRGYPEFTNTNPPAITGPAPSSEPPFAGAPFTVAKLFSVSMSKSNLPSTVE